ncbi:MAG: DUF6873 family GME fold protein [Oscillospiraceae bacterium]
MSLIYLSDLACPPLVEHLREKGHTINIVNDRPLLGKGVSSHPDLMMCKAGAAPDDPVIFSGDAPLSGYPEGAAFCAVILDRLLIHRLDITAPDILKYAEEHKLIPVNVRQGYTKCCTVVVDGSSVITSDPGILRALSAFPNIDVLAIRPGFVRLPGFEYGFLGGASGLVEGELLFNGDLSAHPDFPAICGFAAKCGVTLKYFSKYELTDIGSIIEYVPHGARGVED